MRIVVSDSSCLIDLRKASLLDAFLKLPHDILIPNTLFEDEILKFTDAQKRALIRDGMKVMDLSGESVLRAQELLRITPQLSIHDGFALALAENQDGCILLTGDSNLRGFAASNGIDVRGVLWIVDEIHTNRLGTAATLHAALLVLEEDAAEKLRARELSALIKRYDRLR